MNTLAQQLSDAGYADRILSATQLARILGGSAQRRYGLVNRALKAGVLHRIKRGVYVLSDRYRQNAVHPFRIAQALSPGSYVSMETALSFHGWIPEAVFETVSVVPGRKSKDVDHPRFGRFAFHPLAVNRPAFLELVERVEISRQTVFIAAPVRALMDMICFRKTKWRGLDWIERGLRIEHETLLDVSNKDFAVLKTVYKHKAVQEFIVHLQAALVADGAGGEKKRDDYDH